MTATRTPVGIAPDGAGKSVDMAQILDDDGTSTVYRQAVTIGDGEQGDQLAKVYSGALLTTDLNGLGILTSILIELRVLTTLVHGAMYPGTGNMDLGAMRADFMNSLNYEEG